MDHTRTPLLKISQVAALLNVSEKTIRRLIADREIGYIAVRGHYRFSTEDILKYVRAVSVAPLDGMTYANK